MSTQQIPSGELQTGKNLLSYLSPEEKHKLVGSFVIEDFWDTFNEENSDPIDRFRQLAKESIPEFIEAYQDVWDYVVDINELDDTFLTESIEKNTVFNGLSLEELQIAGNLLSLSLYSELEKDCLMALNKTILGELTDGLRAKYGFSDDEYQLLMTPSFETFFTKYHFDHLEYAINEDPESKAEQREALIRNFHANDPALFELRFADMHFPVVDNMGEMLAMQKGMLAQRAAKKVAFIGEREDLTAFEKLLEYDNFLDFEYRYNLEACPEYYLRKKLFAACQENGIFTDLTSPMALKDPEFIDGVNKLINIRSTKYIIDAHPTLDTDEVSIDGSKETILKYLKKGSPVLARRKGQDQSDEVITIVGYENKSIIAKNSDDQYSELSDTELASYQLFSALQKYDELVTEGLKASIRVFNKRTPYLNRADYEHGFQVLPLAS
ncbi:MAG: hypothetical protein JWO99_253 [Candidatus Saccharibacteria bacterium]|nr:hypothetical protein [Candidatus Saccharibacteria bacterium]